MRIFRCFLLSLLLAFSSLVLAAEPPAPVNINTADVATLATSLKGVGVSKAKAIIAYRENYGPFKSVDELTAVKGIGESLVKRNRERITLE